MADEPPLVDSLSFGSKVHRIADSLPHIAPGGSVDLTLTDASYQALQRALVKLGYAQDTRRLKVYLSDVVFDDDTMWTAGYWFRRDSSSPEKWVLIENRMIR